MGPRRSKRSLALLVGVPAAFPAAIPPAISSENNQSVEKNLRRKYLEVEQGRFETLFIRMKL